MKTEQRKIPKCIVQVPFSKMGVTIHLEKSKRTLQAKNDKKYINLLQKRSFMSYMVFQ